MVQTFDVVLECVRALEDAVRVCLVDMKGREVTQEVYEILSFQEWSHGWK